MRKFRKIHLFFLIFFIIFSLSFLFQHQLKNLFYLAFFPFQKTFWNLGRESANLIHPVFESAKLKKEKEKLELENLELKSEIERLRVLEKENKILKEALKLKDKKIEVLKAEILSKDVNSDKLLINKGEKDGVFKGQVVITPQGTLLGKISEVYSNFSKISLITKKNFNFNCQISSNNFEVLAQGRGNLNLYLTFLPKEKEFKERERVITSSLGGKFPKGFFVGEIERIEKLDVKPYQEAKIKLGFQLANLESVFLIKNFEPWKEN
jgi:rod shape-determining protein MreC